MTKRTINKIKACVLSKELEAHWLHIYCFIPLMVSGQFALFQYYVFKQHQEKPILASSSINRG